MRPCPSMTAPVRAAVFGDWLGGPKGLPRSEPELVPRAVMSTTPAAELAYRALALRPAVELDPPAAATRSTVVVAPLDPSIAPAANSRPVTAPAPSSAAHTATATKAP